MLAIDEATDCTEGGTLKPGRGSTGLLGRPSTIPNPSVVIPQHIQKVIELEGSNEYKEGRAD